MFNSICIKTTGFLWKLPILAGAICLCTCSDDSDLGSTPISDPDNGEVSFVITNESGSGTGSTDSPAVVAYGDTLNMVISQKSSYTDSDGTVFTCEPEATISLYVAIDTVYVQNENLLTEIQEDSQVQTSESGTNPVSHKLAQVFDVGGQSIYFDLGYEVYTYINSADQTIEMPYIKLNQANYGSAATDETEETAAETKASTEISDMVVTITPLASTRAVVNDTVLYNVNVLFNLEAESQNAKEEVSQTIVFSVNYIGAVVSSSDPELVKVEYRTGYVWEEAHDNLKLAYYPIVYRDRYYSSGDSITDTFVDAGHMVTKLAYFNYDRPSIRIDSTYFLNASSYIVNNDSVSIKSGSTEVPDISTLTTAVWRDEYMTDPAGTSWSDYSISKLYDVNAFVAADNVASDGNWQTSSLETGWYFRDIHYRKSMRLLDGEVYIDAYVIDLKIYDQFLVIDGRLIDFLEYQPQYNFNMKSEYGSGSLVNTLECNFVFMGRNFYCAVIDTITQY